MTPYLPGVLFQSCPPQVQLSSCPPPNHPPYYPHREVHTTSSPICCLPLYLSFSWLLSPMSLIPTSQWDPDNSMHYAWQTIVRTTSEQNTLYLSLSATLFVKNTHSKHKVSLYKFLCLLIFWGPNLSEYRLLKEASLIETENYPCPNNRAAVEAGNNGMSGGSFWVPESVDINFPPSLSWHFQWWELSLTWS